ncbi:MAG: DUF4388 domain-containing protein [Thermoleophilia bacterium]|nr:DUF4388 domain-containing protein [Thermoleophilia bacterium]
MILWGSIREFPLFSVLQFLAAQRKSGVLEIQDYEELGLIYLNDGRVEAVSTPLADEKLGGRLVAAGALTERQVRECWLGSAEAGSKGEAPVPVPASLLAAAQGDRSVLVEIVDQHVVEQMMELMYWTTGTFRLVVTQKLPCFAVVPSLDVEGLLLEAYRRVDQGQRPAREKVQLDEELCLTCTLECSPAIKARYLKPDICLWRSMPSVLKEPIFRSTGASSCREENDTGELPFL